MNKEIQTGGVNQFMPDQIYTGMVRHRRIIGVLNGRVIYSDGGNRNGDCLVASMQRWIKRNNAKLENTE